MNRFVALNERIATVVADNAATMACAYLFFAWSMLPLAWAETQAFVFYVSGGILQLVLLPIIMVGGKVSERAIRAQAAADRAQAAEDHRMLVTEVEALRHLMQEEDEELGLLREIRDMLKARA